jgi:hypothetical protein
MACSDAGHMHGLKLGHANGQPRPPSIAIDQGVATNDEGSSTVYVHVMLRHLYKTQPVAEPSDWCEA